MAEKEPEIDDYKPIVGSSPIEELKLLASKLKGKEVRMISSLITHDGVAEILYRIVPLLAQLGVDTRWHDFKVKGKGRFPQAIERLHHALYSRVEKIDKDDFLIFLETSQSNIERIERMRFYGDIMVIHDFQPIALVKKKKEMGNQWVWRCHMDISKPNPEVWRFLQDFIAEYDTAVFSAPAFAPVLPIRQLFIRPCVDPFNGRNKELLESEIDTELEKFGITKGKPIITQVSRFEHLKDPLGVVKAFNLVREHIDCQLILAGDAGDPELEEVKAKVGDDRDIHVLPLPQGSNVKINALQRASSVFVQDALKEGFGLGVSEALWKGKAVVASATGGAPLQIRHGISGLLTHSIEEMAQAITQLLNTPEYAQWLGKNGREHVSRNFLITRYIRDYLLLFLSLEHPRDIVYL